MVMLMVFMKPQGFSSDLLEIFYFIPCGKISNIIDNNSFIFVCFVFVAGESNSRFEAFSFQHTGPESLNSFTAVTNVNVLSRSTPSQVKQRLNGFH